MAPKPFRPKVTAAQKKAYKKRELGTQGKLGGMGGKYGRKAENLNRQQLKRAGGLAASKKRTVSISDTRREGNVTLGPGGKPLTGAVKLLNGNTAVYKGGKRVQSQPKPKPKRVPPRGGSGSSRVGQPSSAANKWTDAQVAAYKKESGKKPSTANISSGAMKTMNRGRGLAKRGSQMGARQANSIATTGRAMSTPSYTTGRVSSNAKFGPDGKTPIGTVAKFGKARVPWKYTKSGWVKK